jgi:hypothetical protein
VSEESLPADAVPELMNEMRPSAGSFGVRPGPPGRKAELKRAKNKVTGVFLLEQTAQVSTCQTSQRPGI